MLLSFLGLVGRVCVAGPDARHRGCYHNGHAMSTQPTHTQKRLVFDFLGGDVCLAGAVDLRQYWPILSLVCRVFAGNASLWFRWRQIVSLQTYL